MPTIRIQTYQFHLRDRYEAGHQLTAEEASALNSLRAENIRNNLAPAVSKAASQLPAGTLLSPDQLAPLVALAAKYDAEYEFGRKRAYSRPGPIEVEAQAIAKARVVAAARAQGQTLAPAELDQLVETLASREDVQAEARLRVQDSQRVASAALESLL